MDTFLQVVGALAVGAGALVALLLALPLLFTLNALRFTFKAARVTSALAMPARIRLEETSPAFADRERFEADRRLLQQAGYRELGGFRIREMSRMQLAAFHHPERRAFAVLYEHGERGGHTELLLPLPGDLALRVSSAPGAADLDAMPGWIAMPGRTVPELLARFDAESRSREVRPVAPEHFAAEVEQSHAREMDWRAARGGPSDEEIRRVARRLNEKVSDADLETVREQLAYRATEEIEEACREQLLSEGTLSPRQWEKVREEVIVVHARMSPREAGNAFLHSLESFYESEMATLEAEMQRLAATISDPRALFATLNAELPGFRYEKIGEVSAPVAADFYRTP